MFQEFIILDLNTSIWSYTYIYIIIIAGSIFAPNGTSGNV